MIIRSCYNAFISGSWTNFWIHVYSNFISEIILHQNVFLWVSTVQYFCNNCVKRQKHLKVQIFPPMSDRFIWVETSHVHKTLILLKYRRLTVQCTSTGTIILYIGIHLVTIYSLPPLVHRHLLQAPLLITHWLFITS